MTGEAVQREGNGIHKGEKAGLDTWGFSSFKKRTRLIMLLTVLLSMREETEDFFFFFNVNNVDFVWIKSFGVLHPTDNVSEFAMKNVNLPLFSQCVYNTNSNSVFYEFALSNQCNSCQMSIFE